MQKQETHHYEYYAFISYKREDEKWAKWLQRKLEYYKLPLSVRRGNPDLPEKIRPVFKDTTDLEPGVLTKKIQNALDSSKFLIVICSPRSANSIWVSKEVQSFIDSGRVDRIIPFIIGGTPNAANQKDECFPEGLRQLSDEQELIGANINEMGREAAAVKVISQMFNLRFDTLWQRYERDKRNKWIKIIVALFVIFAFFLTAIIYVQDQRQQTQLAVTQRDFQMLFTKYLECESQYSQSQYSSAFHQCQSILSTHPNMPDTLHDKYEYILRMSYQKLNTDTLQIVKKYTGEFNQMEWGPMSILFAPDENRAYIGCSGFAIIDFISGKRVLGAGFWPEDIKSNGNEIITFEDHSVTIYDKMTFEIKKEITLSPKSPYISYRGSSGKGERFLTYDDKSYTFDIWDTDTGFKIRSIKSSSGQGDLNFDGQIFATIMDRNVILYDLNSMEEMHLNGYYADELQFDESGKWLILYLRDYEKIRVINLSTIVEYLIPSNNYPKHKTDWNNSYNFTGAMNNNKYYISNDGQYLAIGKYIYDMFSGEIVKILESSDLAGGVLIYPGARKIIQINYDRSIYLYARNGEILFKKSSVDFENLERNDTSKSKFEIKQDPGVIQFYRRGTLYGKINDIFTDVYHISITPDEEYALVSMLDKPTTLYHIKTGIPIEEYPFTSGDGLVGYGVVDKNSIFNFKDVNTTYQYRFISLSNLLKIKLEN